VRSRTRFADVHWPEPGWDERTSRALARVVGGHPSPGGCRGVSPGRSPARTHSDLRYERHTPTSCPPQAVRGSGRAFCTAHVVLEHPPVLRLDRSRGALSRFPATNCQDRKLQILELRSGGSLHSLTRKPRSMAGSVPSTGRHAAGYKTDSEHHADAHIGPNGTSSTLPLTACRRHRRQHAPCSFATSSGWLAERRVHAACAVLRLEMCASERLRRGRCEQLVQMGQGEQVPFAGEETRVGDWGSPAPGEGRQGGRHQARLRAGGTPTALCHRWAASYSVIQAPSGRE